MESRQLSTRKHTCQSLKLTSHMLNTLSLDRKIALIILLSNGILLATVFMVTGLWHVNTIKSTSIKLAESTVKAFSQDFTKIIVFDSPHIAADTVSRIKAIESVKNVVLYNAQKVPVFNFTDEPEYAMELPAAKPEQHYFKDGFLHVYLDVRYEGTLHGTVYCRLSTDEVDAALYRFRVSSAVFIFLILLLTILLSYNLQTIISKPIINLANVVNQVLENNDLSKRARTDEKNEIGQLYNSFNLMIEGIEQRNRSLELKNRELELHRNELEELVSERTAEIEDYVKELETFSYSVSHDLRTPLRAINGFGNILLDKLGDTLEEEDRHLLKRLIESSNRMGDLIDDLLLLARVNQHQINKEEFNLSELIRDIVEDLEKIKVGGGTIDFNIEPKISLYADPKLMRLVVENLVTNAIKYRSKHRSLTLDVGCKTEADSKIIYIKDNGIGFDMKYHEKIFTPFQRLHTSDEYEGTGIGLATVKRIMQRQNGDVWAESVIDEGSTFFLKVPVG